MRSWKKTPQKSRFELLKNLKMLVRPWVEETRVSPQLAKLVTQSRVEETWFGAQPALTATQSRVEETWFGARQEPLAMKKRKKSSWAQRSKAQTLQQPN
jgi:hypothetical protein